MMCPGYVRIKDEMSQKPWSSVTLSILIQVWLYEAICLLPFFSPLPLAAEEKKTYLFAIVPQFPPLFTAMVPVTAIAAEEAPTWS